MDKISSSSYPRNYHWCIVPMCKNTSIKTPEKTFIQVPREPKRRLLWLNLVRRDPKEFSHKSVVFVCEDHFDLEHDMENYLRWTMMGGPKLLKKEAFPHKFECQENGIVTLSESTSESTPHKSVGRRKKMQGYEEFQNAFTEPSSSLDLIERSVKKLASDFVDLIDVPRKTESVKSKTREIGIMVKPKYRSKYTQTPMYKRMRKKL